MTGTWSSSVSTCKEGVVTCMGRRKRGEWMAKVRIDPKGAMEADLLLAAVGVFIIVMGGLTAVAGVHPRWQNVHNSSPAPLLGNINAIFGLIVIIFGLILLVVNIVVWVSGRLAEQPTRPVAH